MSQWECEFLEYRAPSPHRAKKKATERFNKNTQSAKDLKHSAKLNQEKCSHIKPRPNTLKLLTPQKNGINEVHRWLAHGRWPFDRQSNEKLQVRIQELRKMNWGRSWSYLFSVAHKSKVSKWGFPYESKQLLFLILKLMLFIWTLSQMLWTCSK